MDKMGRVNSEIERQVAWVLANRLKDPRIAEGMISVTKATATADLKYCKIYLSFLNVPDKAAALAAINRARGFIRNELKGRMDIRTLPELSFFEDDSIQYGMKIDKLLKGLDIKDD